MLIGMRNAMMAGGGWMPREGDYIINSTFGAWVNTGIVFNENNFKIISIKFALMSPIGTRHLICGNGGTGAEYVDVAADGYFARYGREAKVKVVPGNVYTVVITKDGKYCDGVLFQDVSGQFNRAFPYGLFLVNTTVNPSKGSVSGYSTSLKFYSFKVESEDGSTVEHNLLPRVIDGEAGMYDTITDTFCPNWGTGALSFGHDAT